MNHILPGIFWWVWIYCEAVWHLYSLAIFQHPWNSILGDCWEWGITGFLGDMIKFYALLSCKSLLYKASCSISRSTLKNVYLRTQEWDSFCPSEICQVSKRVVGFISVPKVLELHNVNNSTCHPSHWYQPRESFGTFLTAIDFSCHNVLLSYACSPITAVVRSLILPFNSLYLS